MTIGKLHRFPHDPVLAKLLHASTNRSDSAIVIHDVCGYEKSYSQLFGDVIRTRNELLMQLPSSIIDEHGILHQETPYIPVLTRSGYEFLVAFFAIRAIGGACIPFGSGILPEEASHFLSITKATCILIGSNDCIERAAKIAAFINSQGGTAFTLPISHDAEPIRASNVDIDEGVQLAPDGPGMVLFTSGTTGLPKGAILPRNCFTNVSLAKPGEACINYRPGHWIGGARTLIMPMLSGKELYTLGEKGSAKEVLNAFRTHRITQAAFTPTLLRNMRELLINSDGQVPNEKRDEYASWFKALDGLKCSAGMIDHSILKFWTDLTGLHMYIGYSATELGGLTIATRDPVTTISLIGSPIPNIKVKLSEGNTGEILVKSPFMLIGYVGEDDLTRAAFDEEGYYKTGDLAELRDGQYYFTGRKNHDFAFFRFFRIPLQKVEQSLLDLSYISEACVLAIPDHEAKELCAAAIRLDATSSVPAPEISLARIRSDLMQSLPMYMLPAILRILKDGEEIPRNISGKVVKAAVRRELFATTDWWPHSNPPAEVEYWGNMPPIFEAATRPWDWCGVQRAD
ncbi:hypothetical protein CI102_7970 [Trichoderma harzianum]|uniref:AMP-dependent synthetase/ligase domain-containing protein n=1 Tax=Trichoderma harzianum CBS 226.95 TaxID=983964 RepID=A0A2T3ZZF9_TRIHA|nr:hypothetical protein M431DRAFT_486156 [Trichoderma harzianum CBS 226.95]PKK48947.1 hypothetical protein CI102_7970 [Trichoderma harzianum]PTB50195.1 hypothetical protein M431DRAFT_486156 [Trichoderma harzianum CBS 226.95]